MSYSQSLDYAADIEPQMRGQWHGFIAQEVGIEPVTEGRGKGIGHECPLCGGRDRAHFKEKDGRVFLFCRGACGNTNSTWGSNTCSTPEHLCMTYNNYDFRTLVEKCADWLGIHRERTDRNQQTTSRKNSPTLTPKVEGKRPHPSHHFERARKPLEAILSASEILPWHRITYCQKNALCGDEGEFLAFGNDIDGYDLIVPVFIEASGRVVMTGAVQIKPDGSIEKHGSISGGYATVGDGKDSVFCTDYAMAHTLSRKFGMKAFYSPDVKAFNRCGPTHVYINTDEMDALDRATAFYKQSATHILPVNFSRQHIVHEFEFLSYAQCQARIYQHDEAYQQEYSNDIEKENGKEQSNNIEQSHKEISAA